VERNSALRRFVRKVNALRLSFEPPELDDARPLAEFLAGAEIAWHGVRLGSPDWSDSSRSLAVCFTASGRPVRIWIALNAYWEPLEFELPPSETLWVRLVDTALPSPDDARGWSEAPGVEGSTYRLEARTVVVLGTTG